MFLVLFFFGSPSLTPYNSEIHLDVTIGRYANQGYLQEIFPFSSETSANDLVEDEPLVRSFLAERMNSAVDCVFSFRIEREAIERALRMLKDLRPLVENAFLLVRFDMNIADIHVLAAILKDFALGEKGLKRIVADYENALDPLNDSADAKKNHASLLELLRGEIEFISEVIDVKIREINEGSDLGARLVDDFENLGLTFTGLIEVVAHFNSFLPFHSVEHSLDVAVLSAFGSEPDGPSAMLKAAAEGSYHDSRMIYEANPEVPGSVRRRMGTKAWDSEGCSGNALILQLEKIRGCALTEAEKADRRAAINRTVPNFANMAPERYGAVTNATFLCDDDIFVRRDLNHVYRDLDGLTERLESLCQNYYPGDLNCFGEYLERIEDLLRDLKTFRVGQADLSHVLTDPESWGVSTSFSGWIEIFREHCS